MAKAKTIGQRVEYNLTAEDARRLNERRGPDQLTVLPGQRALLTIDADHGGDCVDGVLSFEGDKLPVERRNRGYGEGQWDWRKPAECETP